MFKTKALAKLDVDNVFDEIFNSFNFDEVLRDTVVHHNTSVTKQTDTGVFLYVDVPGFKKEELSVFVEKNVLTIEGKVKSFGKNRSLKLQRTIPSEYEFTEIESSLEAGVLTVFVPKKNPSNESGGTIKVDIK